MNSSWMLRLMLIACALLLSSCKDDAGSTAKISEVNDVEVASIVLTDVVINDYVVVSSRRVGRTVSEYTLRAIATNKSATRYTNVTATLTATPANITIIDNAVIFGTVNGNADTTSADEFIIAVDLSVNTSLNEMVWQVNGTQPSTGGGGGGGGAPEQPGIFMSIDNNDVIKGDVTSRSHQNWIELLFFSEGSNMIFESSTGETRPTGKIIFDGVSVSKELDSSSTLLRGALTDGDIFTEVKIDIIKTCDTSLYTAYAITLTVSSLTALEMSGSGLDVPVENLVFNYSRIETMYTPVNRACELGTPIYSSQDARGI